MHQILFQFPFSGGNPRTPATGGSAPDLRGGEEGTGGKGKGQGEGEGRGGKGEGGEGKGREGKVCVIAVGARRP